MRELLQELLMEVGEAVDRQDFAMANKLAAHAVKVAQIMEENGERV